MGSAITPKQVESSHDAVSEMKKRLACEPENAELKAAVEIAVDNHRRLTTMQNDQLREISMRRIHNSMVRG